MKEFDGPPPDPNEDLSDPTPEGIVWAKFYQDLSSMGGHRLLGFWHAPQVVNPSDTEGLYLHLV